VGGNEDGRSAGERLAVDPNLGTVLYFGSRHNGLWRSADRGATWKPVPSFPVTGRTNGVGIVWVVFDPNGSSAGTPTRTIYVGVQQPSGTGIYVSRDAGTTWTPAEGQPIGLLPHQAQLDTRGDLYITYADAPGPNGMSSGAVWKWSTKSGQWRNISPLPPKSGGFAGLSLDRSHPGTLVVSTMDRWGPGDDIFRSTNGGETWVGLKDRAVLDASLSPFLKWGGEKPKFGWWMGAVAIDPFQPGRILYATGATIWESHDLTAADAGSATHWAVGGSGVEQTAVTDLISPPEGAHLISAVGDIAGFRHDDFAQSPAVGLSNTPITGSSHSLDFAEKQPNIMVRTGVGKPGVFGALSQDGGSTWTAFASQPAGARGPGHIALSADGNTLVWASPGALPSCSHDRGVTWIACVGLPRNVRPVSDRVNPRVFYAYDGMAGAFLVSEDGGVHFTRQSADLPRGNAGVRLRPEPAKQGHLWAAVSGRLYHTKDGGKSFAPVPSVQQVDAIGLGRSAPGHDAPALYLIGTAAGVQGIFRSDDSGATWTRINDDRHQFGPIGPIIGDPRLYGRVYVGSNGRGILYADPISPAQLRSSAK
jgi:xyloglucan-specific exo-beta-1,4-glucanase